MKPQQAKAPLLPPLYPVQKRQRKHVLSAVQGCMHYMIVVSLEMSDDPIFSSNFKERMPAPIKGNKDLVLIVATTLRCGKL